MSEFHIREIEEFFWRAGAQQVSRGAGKKLAALLEEKAERITKKAIMLANHAGRKTITAKDVALANELASGK